MEDSHKIQNINKNTKFKIRNFIHLLTQCANRQLKYTPSPYEAQCPESAR
jgi:hypothetical protein